jgi:hypothetical protein
LLARSKENVFTPDALVVEGLHFLSDSRDAPLRTVLVASVETYVGGDVPNQVTLLLVSWSFFLLGMGFVLGLFTILKLVVIGKLAMDIGIEVSYCLGRLYIKKLVEVGRSYHKVLLLLLLRVNWEVAAVNQINLHLRLDVFLYKLELTITIKVLIRKLAPNLD